MARVDLPQSRLRARKRRQKFFAALKIFVIGAAVMGLVVGVLWLPHLRVTKVAVEGAAGSAAEAIESTAKEHLAGTYFFMFPKNNILLYPKKALTQDIYAEFPRLAEVDVHAKNFRTIGVTVRERVPKHLWCGASPAARVPCVFMDDTGTAYEAAAQFSGTVYTEYFGTSTGEGLPKQYLTKEQFVALEALIAALKEAEGETVAEVVVDEHRDVYATFENGFTLMFTLADDRGDVYERFILARSAEPFKDRTLSDFEYLDLRFGDRLYYKLKGE